ncbi:MAG: sulfurtransferase-like selenium metabolism protein YedF [Desulfobacterales bacterium]|jgi:selenium metabolism protein YedF|nr:sulfurtransferase-like selenium metabolism protein YedF [Desulfobacterales bacterium]
MEIDARNLSCPAPVLMAKETIEKDHPEQIVILVDNEAARQNVSRFLESRSYHVDIKADSGVFHVIGARSDTSDKCKTVLQPSGKPAEKVKKIMVMAAADRIGFGDDELGLKLMVNFIKTLKEMQPELWKLVFVNNGVKLAVKGSGVLEELKALSDNGVGILVCGTCLTHFNLMDKKQVGETTNMLDIVTAMQLADEVINI